MQKYRELLLNYDFYNLKKTVDETKIPPPPFIVSMAYRSLIKGERGSKVKVSFAFKIKEITGIAPDNQILRDLLQLVLDFEIIDFLKVFLEKFSIADDFIQDREVRRIFFNTYDKYLKSNRFNEIQQLQQITGVEPPVDLLQQTYRNYLLEGKLISFIGLFKRTRIVPASGVLEEAKGVYRQKISKSSGEELAMWQERLNKLEDFIEKIIQPESRKETTAN